MKTILRLERAALAAAFIGAFIATKDYTGIGWIAFAVLLIAPDIAFAAYLAGPKIGALGYNIFHSYLSPVALAAFATVFDWPTGLGVALIWAAHIAADRALGYGLKLPSGFKDTHLGPIGPPLDKSDSSD